MIKTRACTDVIEGNLSAEKTAILVAYLDTPSEKAELAPIPKTPAEESSLPWDTQCNRH